MTRTLTLTDWRGTALTIGDKIVYRGKNRMMEAIIDEIRITRFRTSVIVRPTTRGRYETNQRRAVTMLYATKVSE